MYCQPQNALSPTLHWKLESYTDITWNMMPLSQSLVAQQSEVPILTILQSAMNREYSQSQLFKSTKAATSRNMTRLFREKVLFSNSDQMKEYWDVYLSKVWIHLIIRSGCESHSPNWFIWMISPQLIQISLKWKIKNKGFDHICFHMTNFPMFIFL